MSGILERLRGLDAFPKAAEEFRVRTHAGGVISLVGVALIVVLLASELANFFLVVEAEEEVLVDAALDEVLEIHFDVSFAKLSCDHLAVETVDASGGEHHGSEHEIFKIPLTRDGLAYGQVLQYGHEEDNTVLSMAELTHWQRQHTANAGAQSDRHNSAQSKEASANKRTTSASGNGASLLQCGSCYEAIHEDVIKAKQAKGQVDQEDGSTECCNTCEEVEAAFISRGWDWRQDGKNRFWQCRKNMKQPLPADSRFGKGIVTPGCEVFGSLLVPKAKGSFHFAPSSKVARDELFSMIFGAAGPAGVDMSHEIHSLWFGKTPPNSSTQALSKVVMTNNPGKPPLEGVNREVTAGHLVHYYLKVVPTDIILSGEPLVATHQYAASEHVRPSTESSMPSLHFFYDTPPLRLQYVAKPKTWAHLLTHLCALTGGTYTIMVVLDRALHSRRQSPR